jgi:hypothetical protein
VIAEKVGERLDSGNVNTFPNMICKDRSELCTARPPVPAPQVRVYPVEEEYGGCAIDRVLQLNLPLRSAVRKHRRSVVLEDTPPTLAYAVTLGQRVAGTRGVR